MSAEANLREAVRRRAGCRCEYCLMPEWAAELRFQLDHVIPQQHGGTTTLENLACCCPRCNRHKGPNLSGLDPETGEVTSLFNPRSELWHRHFVWQGPMLGGRTPKGRATVRVLQMNHPDAVIVRDALLAEGIGFAPANS